MGVWFADVAFLICGEYFLQIMGGSLILTVISQVSHG